MIRDAFDRIIKSCRYPFKECAEEVKDEGVYFDAQLNKWNDCIQKKVGTMFNPGTWKRERCVPTQFDCVIRLRVTITIAFLLPYILHTASTAHAQSTRGWVRLQMRLINIAGGRNRLWSKVNGDIYIGSYAKTSHLTPAFILCARGRLPCCHFSGLSPCL